MNYPMTNAELRMAIRECASDILALGETNADNEEFRNMLSAHLDRLLKVEVTRAEAAELSIQS